jgi:hypothetical protein
MKQALTKIVKLIEKWVDNPKLRHEPVLHEILETALKALKKGKK